MANSIWGSNHHHHHEKPSHVLGLFATLLLFIHAGSAYEFKVGGSRGWAVPSDSNAQSYNEWAETERFQVGDTLLFAYQAEQDSVLHVNMEDYNNCNTAAFLHKYSDGHTVFKLNQSGPYYFISGVEDNCHKNEKLEVVVLAERGNQSSSSASPSPSESTGDESTNTPPSGSVEIMPSPSPESEGSTPPPPNAAASTALNALGSIGAFLASFLLLVS